MLRYRYVEGLSQEATADKLAITARHLRRSYAEAVHALSLALWEKQAGPAYTVAAPLPGAPGASAPEGGWHEQLVRELEALADTDAGAVSQVAAAFAGVARLAAHLTKDRAVALAVAEVPPDLMAALHPSALRHILISIVNQLAHSMPAGAIQLAAAPYQGTVRISITAAPVSAAALAAWNRSPGCLRPSALLPNWACTPAPSR